MDLPTYFTTARCLLFTSTCVPMGMSIFIHQLSPRRKSHMSLLGRYLDQNGRFALRMPVAIRIRACAFGSRHIARSGLPATVDVDVGT